MKLLLYALRTGVALACLTLVVLLAAGRMGIVPDRAEEALKGRATLTRAVALHCSVAAQRQDFAGAEAALRAMIEHDPDLASATVWGPDGQVVAAAGDSPSAQAPVAGRETPTSVCVSLALGADRWGVLELRFRSSPLALPAWAPFGWQALGLIAFVTLATLACHSVYLWLVCRASQRTADSAIPQRVRAALNTLVEGVLILDKDRRIALANDAFAHIVNQPAGDLEGRDASDLPWIPVDPAAPAEDLPWNQGAQDDTPRSGALLALQAKDEAPRTLSVNATPIVADDGTCRGTLATFDDLTPLEKKNAHLRKLLVQLRQSRAEIRRQNEELRSLASRDPLTSCLNRRAFFAQFESHWAAAQQGGAPLSCVMVDVDHFKAINDRHGHGAGDQMLQEVAASLRGLACADDLVCRYGGEEFCVLLPNTAIDEAVQVAERFRQAIMAVRKLDIAVTASLGVSALSLGAREPRELLDQADQALYASKRGGRNRVTRWDQVAADFPRRDEGRGRRDAGDKGEIATIPFQAVTALLSALAYRHASTAEHSVRVADLCVATANGLLSRSQGYVLEVAALLHDIGKLGVPDAVLLKPGPLTEEEWKVIRTHEDIGEEILTAAFTSSELTAITRNHHTWYNGTPHDLALPTRDDIPLGARLLSIADAFDAIVSDRVYRKGRSYEEAFAELRRCSGTQFDPVLVERFIEVVKSRDDRHATPGLLISKQTALRIGLQIEKLAAALDANDRQTLGGMVDQLHATACEHDIPVIRQRASRLQQQTAAGADWLVLTHEALALMDLCRSTYESYLPCRSPSPALPIASEVLEALHAAAL